MHDPALATEDRTNTVALVLDVAEYAATFTVTAESAIETARHHLIDALGRGFDALRDPECASLIGPVVPGALMPGGARVPGTSLELEPTQAAFCIALMVGRPAGADHWLAGDRARATDSLGAILAVADYQARKAAMEGKPPPKVRDLLAAMVRALEIERLLATRDGEPCASAAGPIRLARVAATAIAAALLGGTTAQIARAIGQAGLDGCMYVDPHERQAIARRHWVTADGNGRAVRHACQAVAAGRPSFLTAADLQVVDLAGGVLGAGPATPRKSFGADSLERLGGLRKPPDVARLTAGFEAVVGKYFPARQAECVKALFAAPERLSDLPVSELMAALVTNGAR